MDSEITTQTAKSRSHFDYADRVWDVLAQVNFCNVGCVRLRTRLSSSFSTYGEGQLATNGNLRSGRAADADAMHLGGSLVGNNVHVARQHLQRWLVCVIRKSLHAAVRARLCTT